MQDIQVCSLLDTDYQEVLMALRRMETKHEACPKIAKQYVPYYKDMNLHELDNRNTVIVYQGTKLVIPQGARMTLLKILHLPHLGMDLTKKAANSKYFWPGMPADIEAKLKDCEECGMYRDKSGREPEHDEEIDLADLRPWDHIYLDFVSIQETREEEVVGPRRSL